MRPDVVVLRECPPWEQCDVGIPLLVVEVLSPSTGGLERGYQARKLLAAGVQEVWLLDPVGRTVEVRRNGGVERVSGNDELTSEAVPGFVLVPQALWPTETADRTTRP